MYVPWSDKAQAFVSEQILVYLKADRSFFEKTVISK